MYLKPIFYIAEICQHFSSIPFFGPHTDKSKFELENVVGKYMPQLNLRLMFANRFIIGSFFRFKDNLPFEQQKSSADNYCRVQCASGFYIGSI